MGMNTDAVQRLYVAYFNRPADPASLEVYEAMLPTDRVATQAELEAVASTYFSPSAEYSSRYSGMSNAEVVNTLYQNLFGRDAEPTGLLHWTAKLNTGEETFASIALQLSYSAQGTDAEAISAKITAAKAFTDEVGSNVANIIGFSGNEAAASARSWLATVTSDATATTAVAAVSSAVSSAVTAGSSGGSSGGLSTVTLGTGVDEMSGTTFDASLTASGTQTLNSLDKLTGTGATNDTVNATLNTSVTPAGLTNIEVINVSTATNAVTLGLVNANALTTLNVAGASGGAFTASGLSSSVALAVADSAVDHTITFNDVTGTSDAVTVTVAGLTGGAATELTMAGVEGVTIASSGSANDFDLVATSATSLTITGSADITLANLTTAGTDSLTSIDASAATGAVSVTTGNLDIGSTDVAITGGSGADTLNAGAHAGSDVNISGGAGNDVITINAGSDTVSGGDGTDVLAIGTAVNALDTVTGIETLRATAAVAQDFDGISGGSTITRVEDGVGGNTAISFTDVSANVATLALATVANTNTVTVDRRPILARTV